MPRALKRVATIVGAVLCIAAAALLIRRGVILGDALGKRLSRVSVGQFVPAFCLYLGGSLLLGCAWAVLARIAAARGLPLWPLLRGHLRAQIGKYMPGNVFHFAYRHVATRKLGVTHAVVGAALVLETMLLLAAAAIVAVGVCTDPRLGLLVPWARFAIWLAPLLGVFAWIALTFIAPRFGVPRTPVMTRAPHLALVLLIDVVFFLLAGAALRALLIQPDAMPYLTLCGWLAIAWLAGYVTPGAPAGLGLREAVLALGLAPAFGESEALAAALLYRLVTVTADAALAAAGFLARDRKPQSDPGSAA